MAASKLELKCPLAIGYFLVRFLHSFQLLTPKLILSLFYIVISLQPSTPAYGEHYKSGEMRIAYVRGNHNLMWQNKNINGGRLFGGVIINKDADKRHQFMKDITLPHVKHFGDEFHLYSLTWTREQLIMTLDGNEYGRIKTDFKEIVNEPVWKKGEKNAPLDQMVSGRE